jgi:hypothetical protein
MEEEIIYLHNTEVCASLGGCNCNDLHAISKLNRTTIVWEWEVAISHSTTSDTGVWDSGILSGVGKMQSQQQLCNKMLKLSLIIIFFS